MGVTAIKQGQFIPIDLNLLFETILQFTYKTTTENYMVIHILKTMTRSQIEKKYDSIITKIELILNYENFSFDDDEYEILTDVLEDLHIALLHYEKLDSKKNT